MENHAEGDEWRNDVRRQLADTGIIFFSPYERPFINDIPEDAQARDELNQGMRTEAWDFVADRMTKIRAHDLRLVDISDFIIARIDPKVVTYGTIEEITTAVREKKPIFLCVVGGKEKTPLWLMGMFPHRYIYDDLDTVVEVVRAIDSEHIRLSSDRWKLLRKEYR